MVGRWLNHQPGQIFPTKGMNINHHHRAATHGTMEWNGRSYGMVTSATHMFANVKLILTILVGS